MLAWGDLSRAMPWKTRGRAVGVWLTPPPWLAGSVIKLCSSFRNSRVAFHFWNVVGWVRSIWGADDVRVLRVRRRARVVMRNSCGTVSFRLYPLVSERKPNRRRNFESEKVIRKMRRGR